MVLSSYRVARILGSNGNRDCTREFPNFWLRKSVLLILYHCIHINVNSVHPTAQGVSLDLSAPASLTSAQPFDGVHACRSRIQPGMDAWFRGKLVGYMHVIMQCFMPLPAFPHLSEHQARSGNATQHVLVSASREGEHATIRLPPYSRAMPRCDRSRFCLRLRRAITPSTLRVNISLVPPVTSVG